MLNIDEVEIGALLLSPAAKRKSDVLMKKLKVLNNVTNMLKMLAAGIRVARFYFATVHEDYPSLSDRIDPDTEIVQNPHF